MQQVGPAAWDEQRKLPACLAIMICYPPLKMIFGLQVRHDYDEPDFATIDTLFSLAEAHLFMQLVELQDANPGILAVGKGYADIYRSACIKTGI